MRLGLTQRPAASRAAGVWETFPGSGIQKNANDYMSWQQTGALDVSGGARVDMASRLFQGTENYLREGELHCADEGGACACHGLVRYEHLPTGGMAGPRAVAGKVEW